MTSDGDGVGGVGGGGTPLAREAGETGGGRTMRNAMGVEGNGDTTWAGRL